MNGVSAIYLGRHVTKHDFRAYIYSPDGSQKLVNSWDEYEKNMETGLWFSTVDAAISSIAKDEDKIEVERRVVKENKKDEIPSSKIETVVSKVAEGKSSLDNKKVQGKSKERAFEVKDDFLPI